MSDFKKSSNKNGQIQHNIKYANPWVQVGDQATAYNHFIAGLGIKMQHWAYVPNIIGMPKSGGIRNYNDIMTHNPNDKFVKGTNGMYKYMGDVFVIWQGNSKELAQLAPGYYPNSSALVTINRNYIDTDILVGISEFDKLVPIIDSDPIEFSSVQWEVIEHNPTGIDRTDFKIVKVDILVDSNGIEYTEGKDYIVEDGVIKWLQGGQRPGFDNYTGKGAVYSIRYRYVPSFYVKHAVHELRAHAQFNPNFNKVVATRGPISAAVQIDWVFLQSLKEEENDGNSSRHFGDGGNTGPR